jgi:murein DD-endopeptidase MepM/ murein hydrolase activator NlpD
MQDGRASVVRPAVRRLGMLALAIGMLASGAALAQSPPSRARAINGQQAVGFNNPGFNAGGFNAAGSNGSGFNSGNFNGPGFSGGGPRQGDGCGRMLVPAASLASVSRGFIPGHVGLDLAANQGSPVRAAAAGTISYMGTDPDYGLFIDIRHPGGLMTRYGHLSAFGLGLFPGSGVRAGMEIGKVGETGNAHGAHLHFEVRADGRPLDPMPFLVGAACPGRGPQEELLEARAPERRRTTAR